jgi:hypothetical protein
MIARARRLPAERAIQCSNTASPGAAGCQG